ncbi:hypothetical protein [Erythrobacter sp.]|jgi:hypothetical protein|uniref:hypothetical protein n=1 Tax=Erythrobacter sp. TaxID=1042 RepID=UPI002E9CECFF|nr:hypothetical protein [Erythrobacter sp.]
MVLDEGLVSLFGGIIAALMALYTVTSAMIKRRVDQRNRAAELFENFYSGDFYRFSVLPTYRLLVKLRAMDKAERSQYFDAIVCGWVPSHDPKVDYDHFITVEEQSQSASVSHFRYFHPMEEHTEHDALTMFLYFWVKVDKLLSARLIEPKLFVELFASSFCYYDEFMSELAEATVAKASAENAPSWIGAIRRIEARIEKLAR